MRAWRCSRVADGQLDAVAADALVDPHGLDGGLHRQHARGVGDGVERDLLLPALHPADHDVVLLVAGGVAERDPGQEPVELGLGERVGAFVLDRVGGREHAERRRQRERLALDGDLVLLHRLEQRRLGLGRRPVDLVGEQQAGEDGTAAELELPALLVVDERAGQVGGQQVGGELGAREVEAQRLGEGARGEGLAEARDSPPPARAPWPGPWPARASGCAPCRPRPAAPRQDPGGAARRPRPRASARACRGRPQGRPGEASSVGAGSVTGPRSVRASGATSWWSILGGGAASSRARSGPSSAGASGASRPTPWRDAQGLLGEPREPPGQDVVGRRAARCTASSRRYAAVRSSWPRQSCRSRQS